MGRRSRKTKRIKKDRGGKRRPKDIIGGPILTITFISTEINPELLKAKRICRTQKENGGGDGTRGD